MFQSTTWYCVWGVEHVSPCTFVLTPEYSKKLRNRPMTWHLKFKKYLVKVFDVTDFKCIKTNFDAEEDEKADDWEVI